ncbi:hypothetical protein MNBD_NITROSPINAE04-2458 [hydrothermal vent metagenome]|uniref:Thioredoxin-like fold domain-containing protein n=1 Tax=hydrothermal vent metagenome TaxID=652676 RepID=A0A3B1C9F7_9ZZZZ
MSPDKRKVEVFTEGCPRCEETVSLVRSLACENCEVTVWDVKAGCETNECRDKADDYGITYYPSVAVNGKLLDCSLRGENPTADTLRAAGIGT